MKLEKHSILHQLEQLEFKSMLQYIDSFKHLVVALRNVGGNTESSEVQRLFLKN